MKTELSDTQSSDILRVIEETEDFFKNLDAQNKQSKEVLLALNTAENQSPEEIESVLKAYYRLDYSIFETIAPDFLQKRKSLLDERFEFTPKNVENIIRVNNILTENSLKVLEKAKKLQEELSAKSDDFAEDFEIEGTVQVSYNGNNSLIDFDPEHDESCDSGRHHIAELIDFASSFDNNSREDLFYCHFFKTGEAHSYPLFIEEGEYWDYDFQTQSEFKNIRFCWAFHNLAEHSLYAMQDIVRINDFWNEVTVVYQNFNGNYKMIDIP
jgi:hypothetical protein